MYRSLLDEVFVKEMEGANGKIYGATSSITAYGLTKSEAIENLVEKIKAANKSPKEKA